MFFAILQIEVWKENYFSIVKKQLMEQMKSLELTTLVGLLLCSYNFFNLMYTVCQIVRNTWCSKAHWPCLPHWYSSASTDVRHVLKFSIPKTCTLTSDNFFKLLMLSHTSFLTLILPGAWLGTNYQHLFQETASAQQLTCAYSLKLNFYLVFFCHAISSMYILALAFLLSEQCTLS